MSRTRSATAAGIVLTVLLSAAPASAQTAAPLIVAPSGNPKPAYSKARDPDAQQLIETWRSSNELMPGKRVDRERFEILDRQVVWQRRGRAILQFRILAPQGDAIAFARARCGRGAPVELQVFYQFSDHLRAWVPQHTRGDAAETLCGSGKLWTKPQLATLVNPPPLPAPPRISRRDVVDPPRGSPERAAILDALRPRYEQAFGGPIAFRVGRMRVAAGFAYVVVHPMRPNGAAIEQPVWNRAFPRGCFQERGSVTHEYWMKQTGAAWSIGVKNDMCADDSIIEQGDLIGAPPQLVDRDAWPEREFMPVPE